MGSIKIEHSITSCHEVSMLDDYFVNTDELDTSVIGDLTVFLDGTSEHFSDIALSIVSPSIAEAVFVIAALAGEGERETVIIPDYSPVLCLERKGNAILVSVINGGHVSSSGLCEMANLFREVGTLHKAVTERLLAKNPHLIRSQFFRYIHVGINYFAKDI